MARILLVEDEKDSRRMLEIGLERIGHQVESCSNGLEAIKLLHAETEVVVLDLMMPHMDGIALLKELSNRQHAAARIVITSFADKQRTLEALNFGADYLLEKPFLVEQLDSVIQKTLANGRGNSNASELLQRQLAGLPISARERQLIIYVLKGLPNAEIAKLFSTTEATIKSGLFVLYRKLGIASRGELFHLMFPV